MESDLLSLAFNAAAFTSVAFAGVTAILGSFFTNKQQEEALITRFGRHVRTAKDPGLHFKLPLIDKVAARVGTQLNTQEQTLEIKTQDELIIKVPVKIQYEVSDPGRYYFSNDNAVNKMTEAVIPPISDEIAKRTMHDLYGNRDAIGIAAINSAKDVVKEYGLNIRRIVIEQPILPQELKDAFNEVRASERLKEAARNRADAHAIEVITKSEADAKAQINAGQGAAGFRKELLEGYKAQIEALTADGTISQDRAERIVIRSMELDAMRDVAAHGNTTLIPLEMVSHNLADVKAVQNLATGQNNAPVKPAPVAQPA